jgi:hypothetical protein
MNFHNNLIFYGERLLAPCPALNLEDHPFLFVCGCLFIVFAASWRLSLHSQLEDVLCYGDKGHKFARSKHFTVKNTMFPHRNAHKYTLKSPDGKTHNQIDHILIDK